MSINCQNYCVISLLLKQIMHVKKERMLPIMCLNKSMLPMVGVTGIGQVL